MKYDSDKYNNLTVEQYIQIKLDLVRQAKKRPMNNLFGNMQVLVVIERMLEGDLAELMRHTVIDEKDLI